MIGREFYNKKNASPAYLNILSNNIDRSIRQFIVVAVLVVSSAAIASIGPMHDYLINGRHSTIVGLKLPFFDEGSNFEYVLECMFQTYIGATAICACLGVEVINTLTNNLIRVYVEIINLRKDILSMRLENGKARNVEIDKTIVDIIESIAMVDG